MDNTFRHPAPNLTVTGVEITVDLITDLLAWIESAAADAVRSGLSAHTYGLVIPPDGGPALELVKEGQKLILSHCCGITSRGLQVAIRQEQTPILQYSIPEDQLATSETYRIVVMADAKRRVPFGPESQDFPLRPLFSTLYYELQLRSSSDKTHLWSNALPVGLLHYEAGEWKIEEKYLPPCLHIGALPALNAIYLHYQELAEEILRKKSDIIPLTHSFRDKAMIDLWGFFIQSGSLLAAQLAAFEMLTEKGNASELVQIWKCYARVLAFLTSSLSRHTAFYNLLHENLRSVNGVFFTPERFSNVIQRAAGLSYDHDQMGAAFTIIDEFLDVVVPVYKALALGPLDAGQRNGSWTGISTTSKEIDTKNNYSTW